MLARDGWNQEDSGKNSDGAFGQGAVVSVAISWIAHSAELRNRDITPANSATVLTPILL